MFPCTCCGREFSRNFNRKRHEKQCQSNLAHHGKSFDRDEDDNHSLSSTQDENNFSDESDTHSEDDSEADSQVKDGIAPWKYLISQAFKNNITEYNGIVEHFQEEGDSEEHARSKAHNALLKKYR